MKPNLPKRLAARVRAAIAKVTSARMDVLSYEERMEQATARIAEYDADPALFARTYYGRHGAESYPVTTTMARTREDLEYRIGRFPAKLQALREAEAHLVQVETAVLAEVTAMRSTDGREKWPSAPKPLEARRQEFKEEKAKAEAYLASERRERLREDAEEAKEWARLQVIEDAESLREYRATLAAMSPDERAQEEVGVAKVKEAFASGALTPRQLLMGMIEESRKRTAEDGEK